MKTSHRRGVGRRVRAAMRERRERSAALDHDPGEPPPSATVAGVLRFGGLAIGLLASLAWGFALADHYFELLGNRSPRDVATVALVAVNIIAWFAAQQDGRWSQRFAIGAGLVFSAFAAVSADSWHLVAALLSGGPFIGAGSLLLVADRLDAREEE